MLLISHEVCQQLAEVALRLPPADITSAEHIQALRDSAVRAPALQHIAKLASAVLDEQGFVQLRGLKPDVASAIFPAIGSLLGAIFIDPGIGSALIGSHVKPSEALMGNQLRDLPLHTDYSMLAAPPRLTMSLCLQPDPTPGFGAVQVADIGALCFGVETDPMIVSFFNTTLTFASRNAQSGLTSIESPILSRDLSSQRLLVRYHRTRIRQGFIASGSDPSPDQAAVMLAFERTAADCMQTLHPEVGDITVIDNHRTVHARTRCSVRVEKDGSTCGRQMRFLFAH
jgi:alpha-ketoglutarate-dependent taurine dioxygenase